MGDSEGAKRFYERAASEPIAYYGQLAAQKLGQTRLALPTPEAAAEGDERDEAVIATEALYADGLDDLAASLAYDAARQWRNELQLGAMAEVVKRFGDAGTQVQFAKIAVVRGYALDEMAFPAKGVPAFVPLAHSADMPTVYAVARQESEFIWHASSWAGAKGLMQVMPSTAVLVARRAGVQFDSARLIVDPAFNTQLGAALLGQLIEDEGGSRELAFAAYNAGPGRVTQWIAAHGDPRDGKVDLVDWIERIPFDETRDYVERVSENLAVYRQRFADEPPAPGAGLRLRRQGVAAGPLGLESRRSRPTIAGVASSPRIGSAEGCTIPSARLLFQRLSCHFLSRGNCQAPPSFLVATAACARWASEQTRIASRTNRNQQRRHSDPRLTFSPNEGGAWQLRRAITV